MKAIVVCLVCVACGGAPFTGSGSSAAGAAGAGAGGLAGVAGLGGQGGSCGSSAGAAGSAGAGGSSTCLVGWRGTSCDVCSSEPPPATGRTCSVILDCYQAQDCGPSSCTPDCEYGPPGASDHTVQIARQVLACLCP
jgi:hypothetical protein